MAWHIGQQGMGFVAGCSTTVALGLAVLLLAGASREHHGRFSEITVGRINIEEPDGTKRLIISNRTSFPGAFEQGKEVTRPDRRHAAGMLFINDEGTENGGLIQAGSMVDGRAKAGLSLTFDRFRQDQTLQLKHTDYGKQSTTAMIINDMPDPDVAPIGAMRTFTAEAAKLAPAERQAYWDKLQAEGKLAQPRIYLGTSVDRASALSLQDANGKPRLRLLVSAQGQPLIEMLDETGKVVKSVTP
ncbi:hypothetical protein [Pseudoduganella chitinolytica]|uniref:Uncharacterized protein n=1 Tax=Pseudoduganella chitinolytica TaxID=34070 RepID=A0ABY8BF31_9BURK|nr:hypothetical protein [Pseudoduganella chitinolytica]WEF34517.1 hypothetical protein PX653_07065 [Pseudoduganella chitinolytica]